MDVLVIRDRSGSMEAAKADHEGGLRSFVSDQRQLPGEVLFTLVDFDTHNSCEVVCDRVPIADVRDEQLTLVPRGGTPLLDAIGLAISHLEAKKPAEVLCMVLTDGDENSSREWTRDRIKARVADLEKAGWTFIFLGANIDSFAESGSMGMGAGATMNFMMQPDAVGATYAAMSSNIGSYRALRSKGATMAASGSALNFTSAQRIASGAGDPFADGQQALSDILQGNVANNPTTNAASVHPAAPSDTEQEQR